MAARNVVWSWRTTLDALTATTDALRADARSRLAYVLTCILAWIVVAAMRQWCCARCAGCWPS